MKNPEGKPDAHPTMKNPADTPDNRSAWDQAKREAQKPVTIGETFEAILDNSSLEQVVGVLREICYARAEHVETVWQDEALARQWSKAANELDKIAVKFAKSNTTMISRGVA